MKFFLIAILLFTLIACSNNDKEKVGFEKSVKNEENIFECKFEKDFLPVTSAETEEKYKEIELEFQNIINGFFELDFKDSDSEKYRKSIEDGFKFLINKLEENKENDWRLKYALATMHISYVSKLSDYAKGAKYFEELADAKIPAGYLGIFLSNAYSADAMLNLKKAAVLGSPLAQYTLATKIYYNNEDPNLESNLKSNIENIKEIDYETVFQNLVCALRQGSGASAAFIATYLHEEEKNYTMAMEYYWRAAVLGDYLSSVVLYLTFSGDQDYDDMFWKNLTVSKIEGYEINEELGAKFKENMEIIKTKQKLYHYSSSPNYADFSGIDIPTNTLVPYEEDYKKSSKIKDTFQGKWPHEIYFELNLK